MRFLAAHVPYGTDLGKIAPDCSAKQHGTYPAYRRGCRCPHAREAERLYRKRRRQGRSEPGLVDACGTRRRIEALMAIGHTGDTIGHAADGKYDGAHLRIIRRQNMVTILTRDAIRAAYAKLSGAPGASEITRKRAASYGFATPIQWGADIDDPAAVPDPLDDDVAPTGDGVDEGVVERALTGERIHLTDAELLAAVQIATARGVSVTAIAERLHLNHLATKRLLNGELPPNRQRNARIAAELRRDPGRSNRTIATALGVGAGTVANVRKQFDRHQHRIAS